MPDPTPTRRELLRTTAALGLAGVGFTGAAAAQGSENKLTPGQPFGRVYANGVLWRTNVVKLLDGRPDPEDKIYFLHDGEKSIVDNEDASTDQASPFVSESGPGDQDWNGGKWTHFSAEVTDIEAFNDDAPITRASDVLGANYITVTLGRPGFGPPDFFLCPLNGRA